MTYSVKEIHLPATELEELTHFLASYARDGEYSESFDGDSKPAIWRQRLEWWWKANPFLRDDSPLGLILRDSQGEIVGFQGLIPHDYVLGDQIVPSLFPTTFFVRDAHREATPELLMRLKQLGNRYHLVESSPSPESRALLEGIGFRKMEYGAHYYRIVPGMNRVSPAEIAFAAAASLTNREPADIAPFHLILDPLEIESVPQRPTTKLQKRISSDGLSWLLDNSVKQSYFAGLCDDDGQLQAYIIARPERFGNTRLMRILEGFSLDPEKTAVHQLANFAAQHPIECGLPRDTRILAWTTLNGTACPGWLRRPHRSGNLYFLTPPDLALVERDFQLAEGDMMLL